MTGELFPDLFGLPEFFCTHVMTEIAGPNVRIIYGVMRGGQMHWLFSYVVRADLLLNHAAQMRGAAEQSLVLEQRSNTSVVEQAETLRLN